MSKKVKEFFKSSLEALVMVYAPNHASYWH